MEEILAPFARSISFTVRPSDLWIGLFFHKKNKAKNTEQPGKQTISIVASKCYILPRSSEVLLCRVVHQSSLKITGILQLLI